MSGGSGWGSGSSGQAPPGRGTGGAGSGGRRGGSGSLFALIRSWAVGVLVLLVSGYLLSRGIIEHLATDERLDVFTWRLALLHVPAVVSTALTVLAAARVLPEDQRPSRLLYPLASLGVPLVALGHGYAVPWEVLGVEGALMPAVVLVTGSAVGLAVDRLVEDDGMQSAAPGSYDWRDNGTTAMDYLGVIVLVAATVGVGVGVGVGGSL
ncbi:hypothetical protein ACGFR8_04915 [Streptomyces brevispora]|uniref:hypothetical protein n=1 Tax=Streptomyces brevispora TaxID=887462 RepID=UPI003712905C